MTLTLAREPWGHGPATPCRELFRTMVSRITCQWETYQGKTGRTRYRLVGGEVALRDAELFSSCDGRAPTPPSVGSGSSGCWLPSPGCKPA